MDATVAYLISIYFALHSEAWRNNVQRKFLDF